MPVRRRQLAVPELASVEVRGLTREAFLLRSALAAVAVYGAGALSPFLRRAFAQSGEQDVDIALFALGLERLEASYYREGLREVRDLRGDARAVAGDVRESEEEHVRLVTDLVSQLGGRPPKAPEFRFGGAFSGQESFLRLAQTFEDTGVSAYNGAAPNIQSTDVLEMAGRIVQIEARHAAVIRLLRGEEITPGPFDPALEMQAVRRRLEPYIAD